MARGVNKVILIGQLGSDPVVRYSPEGKALANLSIAVSESWKDKKTGEQVEKTEWIKLVAFNRTAEIVGEYLHKGSKIYVEGKLQTRKWTDKEGKDNYVTEVIIRDMQMLDSRGDVSAKPANAVSHSPPSQPQSGGFDDFSDDIPF